MSEQPKRYPIDQSPLYSLCGKGKFETVIGVSWEAVPELCSSSNYRVWTNEKGREIQAPFKGLAATHRRIGLLLSRIDVPGYVYSQKGRSYVDNARQHLGHHPVIKTDIQGFYPSISRAKVYGLFRRDFRCAADVAGRLADICCYQRLHLPTGSSLSGLVAFLAARHLFDDIARLARGFDCTFTVYVDDITLSGPNATKQLLAEVRTLIKKHGLRSKRGKSKSFSPSSPKSVTGVILVGEDVRLPNSRHQKIWETQQALLTATGEERFRLERQLKGREQEANQVLRSPRNISD
ncbi:reverse transcriptase [mine drainage metagenome]|uniref:Reverse transcriptase n=1 Tax=mine drainage metagenome TaxID=410659 RepID=A0A1J5PQQ1_9ZZZZ